MRFSPFVFTALTASAVFGVAQPARAEISESSKSAEATYHLETNNSAVSDPSSAAEQSATSQSDYLPGNAADEANHDDRTSDLQAIDALEEAQSNPTLLVDFSDAAVDPPAEFNASSDSEPIAQTNPEATPTENPEVEDSAADPTDPTVEPETLEFDFQAPQPTSAPFDLQQEAPSSPSPSSETAPPSPPAPTTPAQTPTTEPRVLVSEVLVEGAAGELETQVYEVIRTRPGRTTTRSQLQEDINAIFATGFFSNVQAVPEDTPLGVRVTFVVQQNAVLQGVQLQNSRLTQPDGDGNLPQVEYQEELMPLQTAVDRIFANQIGQTANLQALQIGIEQLNQLYQDNGYVLAQVIAAPEIGADGIARLEVAEGEIENIEIRFLDRDGQAVDEEGEPIRGRTRPFIITREFQSEAGDVFNQNQIQRDLQRAFGLGIFEDLNISLNPGQDPRKVDVVVNVTERRTGSLAASVGISSASGLFGAVSLQEQNLGGNNQRLNAEVQIGQRDVLFDLSFTDPWIATDPNRTSYTVNAFGRQSISLIFDGGEEDVDLPNGDRPRVRRFGGGVSFSRPLDDGWRASLGLQYQNVSIRDLDGTVTPRDEFGNLLSYNRSGIDNIATLQFSASQDRRNDPAQTTSGSVLRLSTEQALGIDSIFYNRLRASYSYYIPVRLARFTEGCQQDDPAPSDCPQTLAFNVQGGTILGDFPPYEAFALGGTDSIRGYDAGDLGSGKSYLQATVEYRFPIFSIVSGALFLDAGTDLGSGDQVQGDPAGIREKPGSGFGYGIGVRVQSPLGQIRVDYAINDDGENRIHFGIGERF
ncbi:MAG: BamA/TamA family outer membrane protein [Elainella sp. Prado103]|jgi:outer membrane protein insertion porin family|nr:BamA/TamA family outer membrane protein [Elainella sp. Prado103]